MNTGTGYRYPGSRPFEDTEIERKLFFGRDREKEELLQKVLAKRLMVLYAKSGLGKTSLINAGLNQLLRENNCVPLKIRFNDAKIEPVQAVYEGIKKTSELNQLDYDPGEEKTLWQYFKTVAFWSSDSNLLTPVLILDQFEEFFAFHEPESRKKFIIQLADLVNGTIPSEIRQSMQKGKPFPYTENLPNVKILISIREDYLGQLEELSSEISDVLQNRFRLLALNRNQARDAIIEPSRFKDKQIRTANFKYNAEAIEMILAFLCKRKERDGIAIKNEIESFQLQLLCKHFEDKVQRQVDEGNNNIIVTREDIGGEQGMNKIMQNFYGNCIAQTGTVWGKKRIRRLIERDLISVTDRRLKLEGEYIENKCNIKKPLLEKLVNIRLLRSDKSDYGTYYELSHDTLVAPIREYQKKRRSTTLKVIAIIAFTLISIIGFLFYQNIKLRNEVEKLHQAARKAELLKDYNKAIDNYKKILKLKPDDFTANFGIGNALFQEKRYDEAAPYYEKVLTLNPDDYSLYIFMGATFLNRKRYDEAIEYFKKSLKVKHNGPISYYLIGVCFANQKKYEKSVEYYKKALKINSDYGEAYQGMADALLKLGKYKDSIEYYKKTLEYKPFIFKMIDQIGGIGIDIEEQDIYNDIIANLEKAMKFDKGDAEAYYLIAFTYENLKNYEKAIEYYKKALKMKSDFVEAYYRIGIVYHERKMYERSIENCKKALELKHDHAYAYLNIGSALNNLGKSGEAVEYFKKALKVKPDTFQSYHNIGIVLASQGNLGEAITNYQKALEINPNFSESYYEMGNVFVKQKKYEKAIEYYKKTIKIMPDYADAYFNIGAALSDLGKPDEAVEFYRKAIKIKPDMPEAYNNIGYRLFETGRYKEALLYYQKALEIKPDFAMAYRNMGNVLFKLKKYDKAIKNFKEALKFEPDDANAYNNLGAALCKQQRYDEAIEILRKAIKIKPDFAEAYSNMGVAFSYRKKYADALVCYKKSMKIDPEFIGVKLNLADLYLKTQCLDKAINLAKEALNETKISIDQILAMKFVSIASLFLQDKEIKALNELKAFLAYYRSLSKDYEQNQEYSHDKDFIKQNKKLNERIRALLLKLIDILESPKTEGDKKIKELEDMLKEYKK
jgi:tetratricopeptide (TPR) repeat protein